ncbi:MAG: rhodanese-like domain-containing protein [Candidatus Hydrogenedentota bacterium]|nr:MAG: rhodanese-like domain-containing protein [Candidatus Hydrogenedentota bacterium]
MARGYLERIPPGRYQVSVKEFLSGDSGPFDLILDVRTPKEYAAGHIPGAINIPLRRLLSEPHAELRPEKKILVYCRSQKRSTHALVALRIAGFDNVWELRGGYRAWTSYGSSSFAPSGGKNASTGRKDEKKERSGRRGSEEEKGRRVRFGKPGTERGTRSGEEKPEEDEEPDFGC